MFPQNDDPFSPKSCPGKFYVNCNCLDHDLCASLAPKLFARDDHFGGYYVVRQPTTDEETDLMQECIEACPMEAIRDNGDKIEWKNKK